jgi:hypothetical protein
MPSKKSTDKRELISPNDDNRYIRRDERGRIQEPDDQGRSLGRDVRQPSRTEVESGQGDKGDQKRGSKK